jgi:Iap family predicted aminopeptidase
MLKVYIGLIFIFFTLHNSSLFSQNERVKQFTKTLCSPEFHGRGYVNGGDSIAVEYIAKTFQEIGLKPFNGSYFQHFTFSVNTFPEVVTLTLDSRKLTPGVHFWVSPNSNGGKIEGTLMNLSFEDVYHYKHDKSKIQDGTILAWRNIGYKGDTLKKLSENLLRITSLAPVIEVIDTKYAWSVAQKSTVFPYLIVQDSVFKSSFQQVKMEIDSRLKSHLARNVIGFLPAKQKTNQTILISAHYDHLGRMGSEVYFPGGNDNASGNAMLVSLAEKLVKNPLKKYNILFVAFAGEEVGLLGSKFMVEHPIIPLNELRFMLNLDIMGSGEEGITVVNSTLFSKEFKTLQKLNKKRKAVPEVKPRGPAANSDHYFFTEAGVPAFFVYTMGANKHYHDVFDTYDDLSFKAFEGLSKLFESFLRDF